MKTKSAKMGKQFISQLRWLSLGIGIKRWLFILSLGSAIMGMGVVYLIIVLYQMEWMPELIYKVVTLQGLPLSLRVLLPLIIGAMIVMLATARMSNNLLAPFRQTEGQPGVAEMLYQHNRQQKGPHIVAIGGGTGLSTLLRGLTQYTSNITAIITVADDGGSSGRLRQELGILPPGDIRNNMAALARDEALMTQLLQYRFGRLDGNGSASGLEGHAFGNLLLAALTGITGSFDEGLLAAERVLALRGRVLPATLDQVDLAADIELETSVIRIDGESAIPKAGGQILQIFLNPATVRVYPPALQAIFKADLIVLGPGSLFTSVIPNLLVKDLFEAIKHSTATTVYVCNIASQHGETDNYTVTDHVDMLMKHTEDSGWLDYVVANQPLSDQMIADIEYIPLIPPASVPMLTYDLADPTQPAAHDPHKLATALINILQNPAAAVK